MADVLDDVDENTPPAPIIPLDPEVEELWSSRALLLVLCLLILSFWVSYYLKVRRIKSVHETIVALVAGGFVGLVVRLAPGTVVQNMISFKNTILLNVLLPPIILNSGFELKQANFFRNFGVILAFAFAGTFISAVVIGVLVYIWALLGLEGLSLGIVECLIFGSTLSATDPVTILAIFNQLKVDPKLYSIIFGESILNDAVAIVMFETLSQFHGETVHILSFFHGVGIFLLIFLTSMALGVVFGLGCSLMLKHSRLNEYPEIESCLIILIAYTSYFFSNGLTMSGIVTLLFCGITLKHYAYHNMSRRAQKTTKYMFASLAQLCENFIFIYLGLSLFTQTELVYKPIFILVTAIAVVCARWAAVFPISKLINVVFRARGQRGEELPQSYQMMLFWAGLRGAVGVALAAGIKGHNAKSLRTTVLVCVVITLVVFGGTVSRMIEIVGIRTGVVEDEDDSSDEEGPVALAGYRAAGAGEGIYRDFGNASTHSLQNGKRYPAAGAQGYPGPGHDADESDEDDPEVLPNASSATFGEGEDVEGAVWRDGQWFNVLDERYLLPVFSNATASRRQATRKAMRSTARLGQYPDQSLDDSPERDLTNVSPGGRSPWENTSGREGSPEHTGGAGHHLGNSAGSAAGSSGGGGGGGASSRGFVERHHHHQHQQTPSLSVAVSSLLSSLVSSSNEADGAGGSAVSAASTAGQHNLNTSATRYISNFDRRSSAPHPLGGSRNPAALSASSFFHSASAGSAAPGLSSLANPFSSFAYPKRRDSNDVSHTSSISPIREAPSDWQDTPLAGSQQDGSAIASTPGRSNARNANSEVASSSRDARWAGTQSPLSLARQESQAGALLRRPSASGTNTTTGITHNGHLAGAAGVGTGRSSSTMQRDANAQNGSHRSSLSEGRVSNNLRPARSQSTGATQSGPRP